MIKQKINENNFQEDKVNKSEDEWGEFESDEEEKNVNANNYQKFEDDDCSQEEKENNEANTDKNRALDILDNNINICTEIKSIGNGVNKNIDEKCVKNNQEKISSNNIDKFKKKKLSKDKIREMVSKIEYTPPNWARNMNAQEFINKVKLYINNKK